MRNKKAKAIRGYARGKTHGQPERAYETGDKGNSFQYLAGRNADGSPLFRTFKNPDQVVLTANCTRGVQQRLKRAIKRAA